MSVGTPRVPANQLANHSFRAAPPSETIEDEVSVRIPRVAREMTTRVRRRHLERDNDRVVAYEQRVANVELGPRRRCLDRATLGIKPCERPRPGWRTRNDASYLRRCLIDGGLSPCTSNVNTAKIDVHTHAPPLLDVANRTIAINEFFPAKLDEVRRPELRRSNVRCQGLDVRVEGVDDPQ